MSCFFPKQVCRFMILCMLMNYLDYESEDWTSFCCLSYFPWSFLWMAEPLLHRMYCLGGNMIPTFSGARKQTDILLGWVLDSLDHEYNLTMTYSSLLESCLEGVSVRRQGAKPDRERERVVYWACYCWWHQRYYRSQTASQMNSTIAVK